MSATDESRWRAEPPTSRWTGIRSVLEPIFSSRVPLWGAFVIVHLWLGVLNLFGPGFPLGDVSVVYRFWTDQAVVSHYLEGIDGPWVYPIVALVPMMIARAFGPSHYSGTWLSLVFLLDLVALFALTGWGRRRVNVAAGWWWVLFLVALGPIALGRIDSITIPLAVVGVVLVASHPRAATVLLTVATWIKVWPAALIAAMIIVIRGSDRLRVLVVAAATSAVIVLGAIALGSGTNVFSFITQQTGRGLQVEAPVSNLWLWAEKLGNRSITVYYDQTLLTWQVKGPGVEVATAVMTPLLVIVVLAVAALAVFAVRNGVSSAELLPTVSLALVTAFIAFNKVGSPQYETWLAVPIILGLVTRAAGLGRSYRAPAALAVVIAALTQVVYPYLYGYLLSLDTLMLLAISVRNILFFVLLGWAVSVLLRSARKPVFAMPISATWPFSPAREY